MKLNYKRTFFVGLAFMSICAFWQVYDNVIPLILKDTFHVRDSYIGIVMAMDNVLALFMLPLFGKLSDKTRTKIGRRMPYILGGTILALLCLAIMPAAQKQNNALLFFIGLGLVLIAMATYRSPAVALMPDVTPGQRRHQPDGRRGRHADAADDDDLSRHRGYAPLFRRIPCAGAGDGRLCGRAVLADQGTGLRG